MVRMKEKKTAKPGKVDRKKRLMSLTRRFETIEWLRKRVPAQRLIDRTVEQKYLIHPAETTENAAIKRVFNRFDEDGNRMLSLVIKLQTS